MSEKVYVSGVGMVPFAKPSTSASYVEMGAAAARAALADAGIRYEAIEQAYAGYVYGDSTVGQAMLYEVGLTGLPIINVNNNCATGSTALFLARQAIASGAIDCALVIGVEQMMPGPLRTIYTDRPAPLQRFLDTMASNRGYDPELPRAPQFFGGAGQDYLDQYGIAPETFGRISVKARRHAANNPYAVFRTPVTLEEVMASPTVFGLLTRLQCCPPTCGAAAAVLVSERYARQHGLRHDVRIRAQAMTTDTPDSFASRDMMQLVGYGMSRAAANAVYERAGVGADDVDVVELHDCFAHNELISYEALGLCDEGGAAAFIDAGDNTYGGGVVTNPSGGLLSKGHPLGATGLAQCYELTHQLRGSAEARQVHGARLALQHNLGLGGACVVTLYEAV